MGFPLPTGMGVKHLIVAGVIAGIGFTVALFVAGPAYSGATLMYQGPAKMGALFSILGFFLAWLLAKIFGIKRTESV